MLRPTKFWSNDYDIKVNLVMWLNLFYDLFAKRMMS